MPTPSSNPIVIIGGGIAGLTAALHLAERGLKPLVLEADPRFVGGRLAGMETIELDGWTFRLDHGVHGIWNQYHNFKAMLKRHGLTPQTVQAREELWINRRGGVVRSAPIGSAIRNSWFPAPLHYLQLFLHPQFLWALDPRDWLHLFHVWSGLIFAVGIDPLREHQPLEGMFLGGLVKGWPPALKSLFLGLAHNGLSANPDEIPLAGFVAFLRFYTLMRRDAWRFYYPASDGGTSLCEPLAEKVKTLGGAIRLGQCVRRLQRDGSGWIVHCERGESPSAFDSFRAEQIILATDAPNASKILESSPGLIAAPLYFPQGNQVAVVRTWFDRLPRPTPEAGIFSGEFTADNFFWLDQIYEPYRQWRAATGGSALEMHIYGPRAVLDQHDAILVALANDDIMRAFPELRGHRLKQALQRNAATHTLMSLGRADQHLGVETPWENLFCCGDWVRHPAPSFYLERACLTGIEAANAVLRLRGLEAHKVEDYSPPEPFVGWIEKLMIAGRQRRRAKRAQ
jgi:isorenieratene synthase